MLYCDIYVQLALQGRGRQVYTQSASSNSSMVSGVAEKSGKYTLEDLIVEAVRLSQ